MKRILVVDDDRIILELYPLILEGPAYDLTLAVSGEEAVARFAEALDSDQPFDLAVIDLNITGGQDGPEILKRLLLLDPEVKAVVSSGRIDASSRNACLEYGFIDILPKPFSPGQLTEIIHDVLKTPNRDR